MLDSERDRIASGGLKSRRTTVDSSKLPLLTV